MMVVARSFAVELSGLIQPDSCGSVTMSLLMNVGREELKVELDD